MEFLATYFISFILYSVLGYIAEVFYVFILTKKITNRGFLYGPVVPIYGFGALLILATLLPVYNLHTWYCPIIIFVAGFLLTSALEYFGSFLIEVIFHMRLWDYSEHKFNINGRVCLLNSSLFAVLVMGVMYGLNPYVILWLINLLKELSIYAFYAVALGLFIIFSIDFSFSLKKHIELAKVIAYMKRAALALQNGVDLIKEKTEGIKDALQNKLSQAKNSKLLENVKLHYPSFKISVNKRRMSLSEFVEAVKKRIKGE